MSGHDRERVRFNQVLLTHLRTDRARLLLAGLFTVGVTVTELLKPWPLKVIIDHAILGKPVPHSWPFARELAAQGTIPLVVGAASSMVLIALLQGLFSYSQIFITSSIGYKLVYALRRELFNHLQQLSLSFHNRARSGDLLTRIAGDTNTLKDIMADSILKFVTYVLVVIGTLAVMISVDWKFGAISLATLTILCISLFHLYRKTKASVRKQRKQEGAVASRMNEVLTAIPLVQAFAREQYEAKLFDTETAKTMQQSVHVARLEAAATRSTEIISALGTAAAVVFGAVEVLAGRMLPGDLVLVASYLTSLYKPVRGMAKLSTNFSKAMASADRIAHVLDRAPEIMDRPDAVDPGRIRGKIVFKDVSFDYEDGRDVLRHVSFSISPGQRIALVGVSGAGKSTIVSLLLRLYEPREGVIEVDGLDIRRYRRESLRREIGLVLQQSILFGASVRENIAYGNPEASMEQIMAAATAANADEFIREMENGYDTEIGERGATLSGGQRQRIAIARAFVRDAPVLVLDEPMTGLDVESEARVREALDRLMTGRTCLMITHDLGAVADADLVLVLEDGRIIERGTHDQLAATSGRYRQLYELDAQRPALDLSS